MAFNVYKKIFDDIKGGANLPESKLLVSIRTYELGNDYSPIPDTELVDMVPSVGITREEYYVARELLRYTGFLDCQWGMKVNGIQSLFYFTSLEDDGAVQDHLDNAMKEANLVNPELLKPFGYEATKKSEKLKEISLKPLR